MTGRPRRLRLWGMAAVIALAALGAGIAVAVSGGGRGTRGAGLYVVPFPGTPDASPSTQIIFPTLVPGQLRTVTVSGSRSGAHAGRLLALPAGGGTAFMAEHPYTAGERVSVRATVRGAPRVAFTFTIATPVNNPYANQPASGSSTAGVLTQRFRSAPALHPPQITLSGGDPDPASGDFFLDAQAAPQTGPLVLDARGRLLWFKPLPAGQSALDVREQRYRGRSVLTYWQGQVVAGHGSGEDVILDDRYQPVATLRGADGYGPDLHEFLLTPRGTAIVTVYTAVRTDLRPVGGARDGIVLDGIVQELDVRTGQLLWEWHALGHVPIADSYGGKPTPGIPYDYFHINSVQELPDGNLLISARNTWAVYEIDRRSGRVRWRLGGKHSNFRQGPGTNFEWQHDPRLAPDGTLTIFDNAATPKEEPHSRALVIALDVRRRRATLERAYVNAPPVLAGSQGSVQTLPDGNRFVGWGQEPWFSEFTAAGRQLFAGRFSGAAQSYRAYRFPWRARPATAPALALRAGPAGATTAYASWNGATDVVRWQLLTGRSAARLRVVGTVRAAGFETAIPVPAGAAVVAVRPLGRGGHALAQSAAVASPPR